jgi:hypothetical protein
MQRARSVCGCAIWSTLRAVRLGVLVVVATGFLVAGAPGASADGDPASDVLYFQDAYVPYTRPSQAASNDLFKSLNAARTKRYSFKRLSSGS